MIVFGPVSPALGADLAARALNREVYEVVKDQAVLAAARRIMPGPAFETWSTWAMGGVSAPMEERDGVVFSFGVSAQQLCNRPRPPRARPQ